MTAPSHDAELHEKRSRRTRFGRWLTEPVRFDDAGLTVLGTVGTAAAAIVLTTLWLVAGRHRCVSGLPPLGNLPKDATVCSAFVAQPEFAIWVMLIAAQVALAAVALVPLIRVAVRETRGLVADRGGTDGLGWVVLAFFAFTGVAVTFGFSARLLPADVMKDRMRLPRDWPLFHYELKINVVVALVLAAGLLAVIGIWVVGLRLDRLFRDAGRTPTDADVNEFIRLRQTLMLLLGVVAAIIGLATLATGALRNAVLALDAFAKPNTSPPPYQFDEQYVLIYGLFFTGLLAVAFLPSFFAMRSAGGRIRDAALPLLPPTSPDFAARVDARTKLDTFLQINVSASASFKASVAIFTPLATALVGLLLPKAG
jgi:hypothetical protein